ncbi:opioid growth factor receptor-like protein 1 isoform X2 [Ascaphus truei]|uniref:opioid growth factor receptor-like protein 1 isoform X2 n=1 Tax=Ascaphus truei TaxID=8439 RepID=UPI003F5A0694
MGNLLNGVSFKEPTTVEDCDSTWESDSGGEEEGEGEGAEEDMEGKQLQQQQEEEEEEKEDGGGKDMGGLSEGAEGKPTPETEQSDSNTAEQNIKPKRSFYAARDLYKYRHQYPNFKDLRCQNDLCNLRFYMNKIPFKPDGVYIEEILNKWKGDYDKLEHNHTYIQWLFPLREQGLNFYAKELTSYEIEEFKKTKEAMKRFLLAYKIMLAFFGLQLTDKSRKISRAANWQERFQHLNESQHNYLRITRILKSLGELGYEHFKSPLVKIFLEESLVENTIPNMKQSALEYFVYTIRDRRERRKLLRFAHRHYEPVEHFIWGPSKIQKAEDTKAVKKTTPPTASHKKHPHIEKKSRDAKCLRAPESPKGQSTGEQAAGTTKKEELTRPAASEVSSVNETKCNDHGKLIAENDILKSEETALNPASDETISPGPEDDQSGQEPERLDRKCDIKEIVIVLSSEEGSKDCLCSLSPVTPNTVDLTTSPVKNVETDLKQKEEAK